MIWGVGCTGKGDEEGIPVDVYAMLHANDTRRHGCDREPSDGGFVVANDLDDLSIGKRIDDAILATLSRDGICVLVDVLQRRSRYMAILGKEFRLFSRGRA